LAEKKDEKPVVDVVISSNAEQNKSSFVCPTGISFYLRRLPSFSSIKLNGSK